MEKTINLELSLKVPVSTITKIRALAVLEGKDPKTFVENFTNGLLVGQLNTLAENMIRAHLNDPHGFDVTVDNDTSKVAEKRQPVNWQDQVESEVSMGASDQSASLGDPAGYSDDDDDDETFDDTETADRVASQQATAKKKESIINPNTEIGITTDEALDKDMQVNNRNIEAKGEASEATDVIFKHEHNQNISLPSKDPEATTAADAGSFAEMMGFDIEARTTGKKKKYVRRHKGRVGEWDGVERSTFE